MDPSEAYEAPSLERVGTIAELTEAANLANSESGTYTNTAFSNP